ncbi:MAG TPA: hypothetical protein VGX48_08805 [Pyrinomonadaceae bacterium]|jgi:hypothetical protein|nr:hypothetical protein [Pyrinomonadaceae bacterium]
MRPGANRVALALGFLLLVVACARAQSAPAGACKVNTPQGVKPEASPGPDATTGIRITVTGADGKPVQRKRFYLLERSAQASSAGSTAAPRREDFLQGASPQLREWLARHDCDTLYCPEYEAEYADAVKTVPEFKKAYDDGLRKYGTDRLALQWLTVNFPLKNVRTEYYRRKKAWLEEAARRAGKVSSVMTDEKGAAFFTGVRPRAYFVSNLAPLDGGLLWDCQVTAGPPIPKQLHSVTVEMSAAK